MLKIVLSLIVVASLNLISTEGLLFIKKNVLVKRRCSSSISMMSSSPRRHPPRHPNARDGDWNCKKCGFSNFASRRKCFRCGSDDKNRIQKRKRNTSSFWQTVISQNVSTPNQITNEILHSLISTTSTHNENEKKGSEHKDDILNKNTIDVLSLNDNNFYQPTYNSSSSVAENLPPCYPEFYQTQ
uniref:RanBP2-type domain-containing protein n=1 Tax=Aureoumbra lagunensis TaxID=44058 RepID=A0A7S3K484_9STRA|mmetsp:Transcript_7611/g.10593  ORF Transcript_7611/g.10593 Transcript_7611/m.10593 type:complete len:185 (+) Transcript_7611:66-620(+)